MEAFKYDLFLEGEKVRKQIKTEAVDPIVQARNLLTQAITAQVLLSLADIGFYEFVAEKPTFKLQDLDRLGKVNKFVLTALVEYLTGCGFFDFKQDFFTLTKKGEVFFNVYTRGVLTIYLGGYNPIFDRLTEILKDQVSLKDKSLQRSTRHAAMGTAFATCSFTIPKVFDTINEYKAQSILDLGCGSGDFLISYLRKNPNAKAWGVDMSAEALEEAKRNAKVFGVQDRLKLYVAEVGVGELPIPKAELDQIQLVTSMYMLHEFGRDGDQKIVSVIKNLAQQLPGRHLLALEVEGVEPTKYLEKNANHFGPLDYNLIHILSCQGLPKVPELWHKLFQNAGLEILEKGIKTGGSYIYIVNFPKK